MASIHSLLQTPGCSSETTHAAPGPEAGAAINQSTIGSSDTSSVNPPEASTAINHPSKHQSFITPPFARYLVIKHQDKDKNILKINPYAMQKALEGLIGDKFVCTRYEKSKFVEIFVRSRQQSETLLALKQLDCTMFTVPVSVSKHNTKNTCKGVIYSGAIGEMYAKKSDLLKDMAKDNVIDIYRLSKTEKGVTSATNTYILTFDAETRPSKLDMGFGERITVYPFYPSPRRCHTCQRYGHGSRTCHNKPICAGCGSDGHVSDDCGNDPKCLHCHGKHSTSSRDCPMYLLEKKILKLATDSSYTLAESRKLIYRDCQDLVSKVPSLSNHIKTSYSQTVVHSPHSPNVNSNRPVSTQPDATMLSMLQQFQTNIISSMELNQATVIENTAKAVEQRVSIRLDASVAQAVAPLVAETRTNTAMMKEQGETLESLKSQLSQTQETLRAVMAIPIVKAALSPEAFLSLAPSEHSQHTVELQNNEDKSSGGQEKSVPNSDLDKAVLLVQPKADPHPPLLPNESNTSNNLVSLKGTKGEKKRGRSEVEDSPEQKAGRRSGMVRPSSGKFAPHSKIKAP